MARYVTTIESPRPAEEVFAYLADLGNAREWDPTVREARRLDDGEIGPGSAFHLVVRFARRDVALRYQIVRYSPPGTLVFEARNPRFVSRDEITVATRPGGTTVRYDAVLAFSGLGRLAEPVLQLIFDRVGRGATAGLERVLAR